VIDWICTERADGTDDIWYTHPGSGIGPCVVTEGEYMPPWPDLALSDPLPCTQEIPMAQPQVTTTTAMTIACSTPCESIAVMVPSAVEGQSALMGKLTPGDQIRLFENHGSAPTNPLVITMVDPPIASMPSMQPSLASMSVLVCGVVALSLLARRAL